MNAALEPCREGSRLAAASRRVAGCRRVLSESKRVLYAQPRHNDSETLMTTDSHTPETDTTLTEAEIEAVVFGTLPQQGMETMTEGGVEFVLCASALTAQM